MYLCLDPPSQLSYTRNEWQEFTLFRPGASTKRVNRWQLTAWRQNMLNFQGSSREGSTVGCGDPSMHDYSPPHMSKCLCMYDPCATATAGPIWTKLCTSVPNSVAQHGYIDRFDISRLKIAGSKSTMLAALKLAVSKIIPQTRAACTYTVQLAQSARAPVIAYQTSYHLRPARSAAVMLASKWRYGFQN